MGMVVLPITLHQRLIPCSSHGVTEEAAAICGAVAGSGYAMLSIRLSLRRCALQVHLNEGPALARALEKLPRSLRDLKLTSLDGMRTAVPLGMQLQGLTQVTALTLASRWGCGPQVHSQLPCPQPFILISAQQWGWNGTFLQ